MRRICGCLGLVFGLVSGGLAANQKLPILYVNDSSLRGDVFTSAQGSDRNGDGSSAKPFATLGRAVSVAVPGSIIRIDAGDYVVPKPVNLPSRISVQGSPKAVPKLRGEGDVVLRAEKQSGISLQFLHVAGGAAGVEWVGVTNSKMEGVTVEQSKRYGILLRDCQKVEMVACRTDESRFRGLQMDRCRGVVVKNHLAQRNKEGGIVLRNSHGNVVQKSRADRNAMSGFFLSNGSSKNRLTDNTAEGNQLAGFYLLGKSNANNLTRNRSRENDRGFTCKGSSDNTFTGNLAEKNRTYGFVFKDGSPGNILSRNRSLSNPGGDLVASLDSPIRVRLGNHPGAVARLD
jgi:parallel beta-helix repeat protein